MTDERTGRPARPTAVIFDLDGTLLDSPALITEAFTVVLAEFGVAAETAAIRATIGTPLDASLAAFLGVPVDDPVVARAIARYRSYFRPRILARARELVFPAATAVLTALRGHARLGVATSKLRVGAEEALTAAGLRDFFDVVATTDQVRWPKPHPEMARFAAARLGVGPAAAVVVGDSTADMAMARAAGMRAIGVGHGVGRPAELRAAGADAVVADLPGVLAALGDRFA